MTPFGATEARAAADVIRSRAGGLTPTIAIILGSGLGQLAHEIEARARIPYREVPGFPPATVAGHAGELIVGTLCDKPVIAFAGRFHAYEGHDVRLAAFPPRVAHALGAKTLIVSNAAGGINRLWQPGELMLIRDHINLMFRNPLFGQAEDGDLRFPDMSEPYDSATASIARTVAAEQGILLREGVYAALLGPAYETPAEVRMLEFLGADAVGMSTVPEVIVARAIGMRVLGISCITNLACGLTATPITHDEVLETTARAATRFASLVRGVVARLQ
ncbi:MAG TPA: purine-nucleoside phosphorylase [Gemmatimonadaceae bacterium]|nr:purine-nucleoside phosphorylase [Gemmatimonadaceae bacterium]